ncbi:hypothetical protein [Nonomuraea sp. SYSU D8015]|uniref:hypothetical protein n=1 Tax=Nonomuraea sp. SYSU D8015 TaxID=2593644 RepID=UPI001660C30C|nr:hypothetical protein [Nonomuraea sp. SYSU D8015]
MAIHGNYGQRGDAMDWAFAQIRAGKGMRPNERLVLLTMTAHAVRATFDGDGYNWIEVPELVELTGLTELFLSMVFRDLTQRGLVEWGLPSTPYKYRTDQMLGIPEGVRLRISRAAFETINVPEEALRYA